MGQMLAPVTRRAAVTKVTGLLFLLDVVLPWAYLLAMMFKRIHGVEQMTKAKKQPKLQGQRDGIREAWLVRVAETLRPVFEEIGYKLPKYRISCGFTGSKKKTSIGVCWAASASKDNTHEIFVHPNQAEPLEVAAIVAHELTHAAVGLDKGHGKVFAKVAHALGLEGKMTATVPGDIFKARWAKLAPQVGDYPHAPLTAYNEGVSSGPKKQGTRLAKVSCDDCGYTMRVTRKWLDVAVPACPNDECRSYGQDMTVEGGDEGDSDE